MKKIRMPHLPRPRSFDEKFKSDGEFFGSREKKAKVRYGRIPRILLCMLGGVLLTGAIALVGGLWKVSDVTAADGQLYSASVVEEYADVQAGDKMLGFDASAVVKRLKKGLPLLDKVKVRKHLNGKVTITFTEVTDLYYTQHNGNYYIISAEDREVLGVFSNPNEAKRVGAVYVGLPEATRVRVGEELS
ncbi:MAG: FtsQ-type POTRA domain-containing protein, partial [Clostridia bacterium]|nr:FtsQ-type POTRA domain-containing protein [Clostridia bacterium]